MPIRIGLVSAVCAIARLHTQAMKCMAAAVRAIVTRMDWACRCCSGRGSGCTGRSCWCGCGRGGWSSRASLAYAISAYLSPLRPDELGAADCAAVPAVVRIARLRLRSCLHQPPCGEDEQATALFCTSQHGTRRMTSKQLRIHSFSCLRVCSSIIWCLLALRLLAGSCCRKKSAGGGWRK